MDLKLKTRYGKTALIAGASEGIGAAFSKLLASEGINLVLLARRELLLREFARTLEKYNVDITCIAADLSDDTAAAEIKEKLNEKEIDILVYNAALSHIGPFNNDLKDKHMKMAQVNMLSPLNMIHLFGQEMLNRGRGAVILMSSLAGLQGSAFISMYSATKAFNRVLGESLWYEWKEKGVDVMACLAGSTSTPGFIESKPGKMGFFAPRVQKPEEVADECLRKLGKQPSLITGRGNRLASFFMQRFLSRKMAVKIMGDNTKKIYRL